MAWLDTLRFWRNRGSRNTSESEVDGCFTLPGIPIDHIAPVDQPSLDDGSHEACEPD